MRLINSQSAAARRVEAKQGALAETKHFVVMEGDLDEPNLRTPSHDYIDFAYRWSAGA